MQNLEEGNVLGLCKGYVHEDSSILSQAGVPLTQWLEEEVDKSAVGWGDDCGATTTLPKGTPDRVASPILKAARRTSPDRRASPSRRTSDIRRTCEKGASPGQSSTPSTRASTFSSDSPMPRAVKMGTMVPFTNRDDHVRRRLNFKQTEPPRPRQQKDRCRRDCSF